MSGGRRAAARKRQVAGATDPYWANRILVANFDTGLTDEKNGIALNVTGTVNVTEGYADLGNAAGHITHANDSGMPGDFVIEWVYNSDGNAATGYNVIAGSSAWTGAGTQWHLIYNHPTWPGQLSLFDGSVNAGTPVIQGTIALNNSIDHHIAIACIGRSVSMYVDGTRIGSAYTTPSGGFSFASGQRLGATGYGSMRGKFNAYRITEGSNGGYTGASITVPALPFPTQG